MLLIFEASIISLQYIQSDKKAQYNLTRIYYNYCHAVITGRFWLNIKPFYILEPHKHAFSFVKFLTLNIFTQ